MKKENKKIGVMFFLVVLMFSFVSAENMSILYGANSSGAIVPAQIDDGGYLKVDLDFLNISAGDFAASGNLTLGEKITFTLGEMVDNIVDGWIRVTGNLNVTGNNFSLGGKLLHNNNGTLEWGGLDMRNNVSINYGQNSSGSPLPYQLTGAGILQMEITDETWTETTSAVTLSDATKNFAINTNNFFVNATSGNVGIGTVSPSRKLEIGGTANSNAAGPHLWFRSDADAYPELSIYAHSHDNINIGFDTYFADDGNVVSSDAGSNFDIYKNSDLLRFRYDSGVAAGGYPTLNDGIVLDSSGNVGIGTTEPVGILSVSSALAKTDTTFKRLASFKSSEAYAAYPLELSIAQRGHATAGSQNIELQAGHYGLDFNANLILQADGGNVGIGTASPGTQLDVSGTMQVAGVFLNVINGANRLGVASSGTAPVALWWGNTEVTTSSDRRLKKNIVNSTNPALENLNKIRIVDFEWDDPAEAEFEGIGNTRNSRGIWTGLIAQDVVEVLPFTVNAPRPEGKEIDWESNNTWFMDYDAMIPVLVKGIQELSAENDELKEIICRRLGEGC